METVEVLEQLLELAVEAGLEVRAASGRSRDVDLPPPSSGVCRVRGSVWVVLSAADPPSAQIDVLADALKTYAGAFLSDHYLPPAVRELLGE